MVEHSRRTDPRPRPGRGPWPVFAALGHPVRLAIVDQLRTNEQPVTELARAFPVSLQAVSKHVRVLETAGVVRRRVVGRIHWIGLDAGTLAATRRWLDAPDGFWSERLSALAATLEDASDQPRADEHATAPRDRTA